MATATTIATPTIQHTKASRRTLYAEMAPGDVLQAYDWSSDAQDMPEIESQDTDDQYERPASSEGSAGTAAYAWLRRMVTNTETKMISNKPVASLPVEENDSKMQRVSSKQNDSISPTPSKRKNDSKTKTPASDSKNDSKTTSRAKPARTAPRQPKAAKVVQQKGQQGQQEHSREETQDYLLRGIPLATMERLRAAAKASNQKLPAYVIALLQEHVAQ